MLGLLFKVLINWFAKYLSSIADLFVFVNEWFNTQVLPHPIKNTIMIDSSEIPRKLCSQLWCTLFRCNCTSRTARSCAFENSVDFGSKNKRLNLEVRIKVIKRGSEKRALKLYGGWNVSSAEWFVRKEQHILPLWCMKCCFMLSTLYCSSFCFCVLLSCF